MKFRYHKLIICFAFLLFILCSCGGGDYSGASSGSDAKERSTMNKSSARSGGGSSSDEGGAISEEDAMPLDIEGNTILDEEIAQAQKGEFSEEDVTEDAKQKGGPEEANSDSAKAPNKLSRLIIYFADFTIEIKDKEASREKFENYAIEFNGYVQRSTLDYLIIRIPVEKFQDFVALIEEAGIVKARDIQAQDVTEEYFDLQVRLETKEKIRLELLEILKLAKQKSESLKDALEIQKELESVVEEIETLKGRMKYLRQLASFSTIKIRLEERIGTAKPPKPASTPFNWVSNMGLHSLYSYLPKRY